MNNHMKKVAKLVDRGYDLDKQIKDLEEEFKIVKDDLKSEAEKQKLGKLEGIKGVATISPTSGSACNPRDFHNEVQALEMDDDVFYGNVKVLVGDAKKALGEVHFSGISESFSIPYNKIQFKAKK